MEYHGALPGKPGRLSRVDQKDYPTSRLVPITSRLPSNDFAIYRHEAAAFSDEAAKSSFFIGICVSRSARIWKMPGIRCPVA